MRTLLHSLPVLVTIRSRDGAYTGVFTDHQVLDYPTPRDLIGKATDDVLNPPAADAIMEGVRATLDTGEHQRIEFPITIGGERFWRAGYLAPYDLPGEHELRLGTNVAALLTDRQYEALEVAYRSGYFEKDRRHNLSEIAESQPVSRWTFGEHLRVAQRKLLAHLLN